MADYFIADTHFGDKRIMLLESRPFKTVDAMDNSMINRWNEEIDEYDTVYVLGDFTMYTDKNKVTDILKKLNGHKILIMGNHDDIFTVDEWKNMGFDMVIPYPIIYNDFIILSHEPKYVNKAGAYVNIFGHVHNNPNYRNVSSLGFCVSAERLNYTPLIYDKIEQLMFDSTD